jgi:hypothetical protein
VNCWIQTQEDQQPATALQKITGHAAGMGQSMADHVQITADTMQAAGSTVAIGSWGVASIGFLDHHAQGILALCGLGGFIVAAVGCWLKWQYTNVETKALLEKAQQDREAHAAFMDAHHAKMKELRGEGNGSASGQ